ncbi:MAG: ChaN family lipoprotein [Thiohalobacterales bacterium]|nr:ChaN family lipoprotein [Thiohalobacterales bacterium]
MSHTAAVILRRTAILLVLFSTGCTSPAPHGQGDATGAHPHVMATGNGQRPVQATPALDLGAFASLETIIPRLAERRVVFVGESHNRFDHHLTQLEIIRGLHARHPSLAIGMEMFQQPFQPVLDDYIAGRIDEQAMLRGTEYYQRWRYDYRLYAPILRYAREHGLPVIALNLPAELTRKVGREGIDALTPKERAQLPVVIDRSNADYEQRLRRVFEQHPANGREFASFVDVQLLWDEGMAERAATYLDEHPDHRMVILAGSGHLAWGSGIPDRLVRRTQASSAIVLNGWQGELEPGLADFILLSEKRRLPPGGRFGVLLDDEADVPVVENCMPDSPCTRAGLKRGDRFLSINGAAIESLSDLRLAMWDKQPGETVQLRVQRTRWFAAPQEMEFDIELR